MLRVRTVISGFAGGPGLSTQYFTVPTENMAAVIRCRQYVHDLFGGCLGSLMSNQSTWTVSPDVDVVTAATGAITSTISEGSSHTATGGGGVDMGPSASAALIRLGTSTYIAGRRIQGRTFVSPIASAIVNSAGQVSGTVLTARNAALAAYLAAFTAGDIPLVWHRPKPGFNGSEAAITALTCREKIAVLTSRRD